MAEKPDLAIAAVERILKKAGAERVAAEAAKQLAFALEEIALKISKEASSLAEHTGRKTVVEEDVKLAKKNLGL